MVGESFVGRVAPESRALYEEELTLLTQENPGRTVEHRVLVAEGWVRWQQWTDTAIFDTEGRIVEYQSVGRDVTERREAKEALRRSEAGLVESQRMAHLGTWEWDVVTGEVWWSEETYLIHGIDPEKETDLRGKVG